MKLSKTDFCEAHQNKKATINVSLFFLFLLIITKFTLLFGIVRQLSSGTHSKSQKESA